MTDAERRAQVYAAMRQAIQEAWRDSDPRTVDRSGAFLTAAADAILALRDPDGGRMLMIRDTEFYQLSKKLGIRPNGQPVGYVKCLPEEAK